MRAPISIKPSIVSGLGIAAALCAITLAAFSPASAQPPHHCSAAASEQAQKLLVFHFGQDNRIEIDKAVKTLAPIRNPANRAQRLDVLEVWGHIYKGEYRMRFIYAQSAKECLLMGQEILEYASL
jgi:hypothetical protein